MDSKLVEILDTVHGKFYIYELRESTFWEVFHVRAVKGILFHSLEAALRYVSATERTTEDNWGPLLQQAIKDNHAPTID